MAGVKHHTTTDESNDSLYDFSETAWEEDHDIDDAGIPQSKLAPDIQVITGPAWTDPTGSGPYVLQFNSGANKSRLCWYDGTVWDYIWGGNCHVEEFPLASGTVGVRDVINIGTAVVGTTTPTASQHTGTYNANNMMGLGVALADCSTVGNVFPVLVNGRMQLVAGGVIAAGLGIVGGSGGKAYQLSEPTVDEAGLNAYSLYYSRRIGIALTRAGSANALFWALINP